MTQEGIARASGIDVPHFAQYVRPLVKQGLIQVRMAHVRGVRRRRNVYDLTDAGKFSAIRLRDGLKSEVVRVRDRKEVREASVSQVLKEVGSKASVLDVLRQVMETGMVDLADLTALPTPSFVEMVSDAPRLRSFVGRRGELDAITGEADTPRMFVVRGVAGIGKSSLGAQAAELLRGKRNLFWHRIRSWDTTSSILASVGDFLSALGKPGVRSVLSRGEMSRTAQVLREDLPGTKAFLVFDDAHEASEEAFAFFRILKEAMEKSPDAKALILTRRALSFYDRRDVVLAGLVTEVDLQGLDPQDVTALVSSEPDALRLEELSRGLGGHPLFLDLVRAQPAASTEAVRDMHRFIKEEIYEKLSGDERTVMKTASLYGVPVPLEALFPVPGLPTDVVFSLWDRSLIRHVGEDLYEVHDTIRDFFAGVLTSTEQRQMGAFAIEQLRRLASKAYGRRDFVSSIHSLSNALRLSKSPEERGTLQEALGDALEGIGDLPAAMNAYRESVSVAKESEVLARLHRKMAWALEDRGELKAASAEVEEGVRVLGMSTNVERGWLDLIRCSLAQAFEEWEEAREHGESALRTFQRLRVVSGQAQAFLALGNVEANKPKEDASLAERYYQSAVELSDSVADPAFTARLHLAIAWFYLNIVSDVDIERAKQHFAAIEAMPEATADPHIRRSLLLNRGWLELMFQADYAAAEADFTEAMAIGRQIHDAVAVLEAKDGLAQSLYYRGEIDSAGRNFEELAEEFAALGLESDAIVLLCFAAECCLLRDDLEGFSRVVASLNDPNLARGVEARPSFPGIFRGLDRLVQGDREGCRAAFEESLRLDRASVKAPHQFSSFYYSIALRVMGEEHEADRYLRDFVEGAERRHRKARLSIVRERERRLTVVLRRAYGTSSRGRPDVGDP